MELNCEDWEDAAGALGDAAPDPGVGPVDEVALGAHETPGWE